MKRNIALIVVGLTAALGFIFVLTSGASKVSSTSNPTVSTSGVSTATPTYSKADVAKHASASDCWTIVDGSVYNITSYIPQHPGGVAQITQACGVDATDMFNGMGAAGRNHTHSGDAQDILHSMQVGKLLN